VLLIEADLRNPTFARRYGIRVSAGLSHVLTGELSFSDAVIRHAFRTDDESAGTMDVLLAGARPPNPSYLLQSVRMAELVRTTRNEYDLVIIDTPPVAAISDAIPLIALVEGVLVVVRLGRTLRDHIARLRRQLDHVDAPVLGLVVNSAEPTDPYAYEYGYDQQDPPSTNGHRPDASGRGAARPAVLGRTARGDDR
jgi:capsular exopolysaccharide synthesis family protein